MHHYSRLHRCSSMPILAVLIFCFFFLSTAPSVVSATVIHANATNIKTQLLLQQHPLPALVYFVDSTDVNSMRFVQFQLPLVEKGLEDCLDVFVVDVRTDSSAVVSPVSYLVATMDVQAIPSLKLRLDGTAFREFDREWKAESMVQYGLQMLPAATATSTASSSVPPVRVNDKTTDAELRKYTAKHKDTVVVVLLSELKDKTTTTAFRSTAYAYKQSNVVRFVELKGAASSVLGAELKDERGPKGRASVAVWKNGERLGVASDPKSVRALLQQEAAL